MNNIYSVVVGGYDSLHQEDSTSVVYTVGTFVSLDSAKKCMEKEYEDIIYEFKHQDGLFETDEEEGKFEITTTGDIRHDFIKIEAYDYKTEDVKERIIKLETTELVR